MSVCRAVAAAFVTSTLVLTPLDHHDPIRDAQWHLAALQINDVHALTQGAGVTVAVIDTGISGDHPDLAGGFTVGLDLTGEQSIDGLTDRDGHGTLVAGLIAAHGRALGIAPQAKLMSVRTSASSIDFASTDAGVTWAVDHGAKVICVASGEPGSSGLRDAINRALDANVVVVAGAGNTSSSTRVTFPAAYPGVMAVAGVDRNGNRAPGSVTGSEVAIAAPGVDIASTDRTGAGSTGYVVTSGTSDATAIIAGAAALVRSKFPNLSAAEVVHRLTATADDKGPPGRDVEYGYGVVNIVKALTADVPPLQSATPTQALPSLTPAPPTKNRSVGVLASLGIVALFVLIVAFSVWRRLRRN